MTDAPKDRAGTETHHDSPPNDGDHFSKDAITDFENLHARQTGLNSWVVLNLADGKPTGYRVRTRPIDCECPDATYNRQDGELCKHLAYALFVADENMHMQDQVLMDLATEFRNIESATEACETAADQLDKARRRLQDGEIDDGTEESADNATENVRDAGATGNQDIQKESTDDGVQDVLSWLSDLGVPTEKVSVWRDREYNSVQLEPDGYLDDGWDAWVEATNKDEVWSDSDHDKRFFIKEDNIQKVLQS